MNQRFFVQNRRIRPEARIAFISEAKINSPFFANRIIEGFFAKAVAAA